MGLLERVHSHMQGQKRAWPVGEGVVLPGEKYFGHDDSRFSPPEYGDYVVTSADVHAAVSLRARLMSGLDLQFFSDRGTKKKTIESGPVVDLFRHVNPHWTLRRLLYMDELAMGLWGESFWAVEKDRLGRPTEIWWMKPSRVRPVVHETQYLERFLYESETGVAPLSFRPDEVVWFRYPNPLDEFSPMSPLAAARLAADTGSSMMKANQNLFEQGLMSGGLVVPSSDKVTFSADQAKDLERDLSRRMQGVDNAHRWAVLRYEAQFKGLNVSPEDAQFVEGMNLTLRQVGNAYGVPTPLLNDMQYATLSNAREYQQILWAHALVPDADLRASEIEEQLLPMFGRRAGQPRVDHVAWDYSAVPALQEAKSEVWDRDRQAMEVGALTINEWRERNGLPPKPWGDVWWAPSNKFAVDDSTSGPEPAQPEDTEDASPERDLTSQINAVALLVRTGFDPEDALRAVGLDPITHLGLLPVTLQPPEGQGQTPTGDTPDDDAPQDPSDGSDAEGNDGESDVIDERVWRHVVAALPELTGHAEMERR